MDDPFRLLVGDGLEDFPAVGKVAEDEAGARVDRIAVPFHERIKDHDIMAAVEQIFDGAGTDIAGAAGNEDFHGVASGG